MNPSSLWKEAHARKRHTIQSFLPISIIESGMGSKLHQINKLFTTLQKNNCNVLAVGLKASDTTTVSHAAPLKARIPGGLDQIKVSMDRDSVRNTMLKQQEIFKQQVYELHRLYRIQKMLMAEMGNQEDNLHFFPRESGATAAVADIRTRIWSSASTSDTSYSSHVSNVHQSAKAGLCSRELSICSWDRSSAIIKGFDLQQRVEECSSKGKQLKETCSEVPHSWPDDGSDIELTLSIGCGSSKKQRTNLLHRDTEIGCSASTPSDTTPPGSSRLIVEEKVEEFGEPSTGLEREILKSPPWFLGALNLNKT